MAGGDRSGADTALIAALAAGRTVQAAAEQTGIGERTARRGWRTPASAATSRTRAALLEQAIGGWPQARPRRNGRGALAETTSCSTSGGRKEILDHAVKGLELVDLTERVAALEQAGEAELARTQR